MSLSRSNINYLLIFLAELFEKRLEYRTIGVHRSAISAFHDLTGNMSSAFLSGIFNKRPTQPKYSFILEVESFRFSKEASRKSHVMK